MMKTLFRTTFIILALMVCTNTATAQKEAGSHPSREKLAEIQARHIAADMALDEAKTKTFVELYCDYQKSLWQLNSQKRKNKKHADKETTDEEIEKMILERFENSQSILDLRRKFYKEYREIFTPRQVEQMYRSEKRIMNRLLKHEKFGDKRRRAARHAAANTKNRNND